LISGTLLTSGGPAAAWITDCDLTQAGQHGPLVFGLDNEVFNCLMAQPESNLETKLDNPPNNIQLRDVETGACGAYIAQYTKAYVPGGGPLMTEHDAICEMQWVELNVVGFRAR
jgi:hypothetical protein